MASIDDYASGRVLRQIRLAHAALGITGIPVAGRRVKSALERRMEPLAICPATLEEASAVIERSRHCAAGERICRPIFPDTAATEAVFLDDLADRLVAAGKARNVTKNEAVAVLERYPGNPLLLSRVSGQYLEICRSDPAVCIWWKMRRAGLDV